MQAHVVIGAAHWVYLLGVAIIVLTMIWRANVVVPSVIATFLVTLAWTSSPVSAVASIFNASFTAAKELFNIFLVIALMTALLNALKVLRSDIRMVEPFRAVMKNGHAAYFVLAAITYVISLFFWPTPAVPLVSAVLLPAAIAAGLPPLAGALAIAIAGQGMALSSDYVIGVAPGISAKAAGAAVSVATVADRALVLSLITGIIALVLAYLAIRKSITPPDSRLLDRWQAQSINGELARIEAEGTFDKVEIARGTAEGQKPLTSEAQIDKNARGRSKTRSGWSKLFAIATPVAFLCVIAVMVLSKFGIGQRFERRGRRGAGRRCRRRADDLCRGLRPTRCASSWTPAPTTSPKGSCLRSGPWARCCRSPASSSLAPSRACQLRSLACRSTRHRTCCSN